MRQTVSGTETLDSAIVMCRFETPQGSTASPGGRIWGTQPPA